MVFSEILNSFFFQIPQIIISFDYLIQYIGSPQKIIQKDF